MIYLDNAATTLHKPRRVAEAVYDAIGTMGNSSRGTHESSLEAAGVVFETRCKLARLFGCPGPELVAFASNATEALNTAISGLLRIGDHVITTDCEHNSVLRPLYRLEDEGGAVCLTGGLCECGYIVRALSDTLKKTIVTRPEARYAGAIGAALTAMKT